MESKSKIFRIKGESIKRLIPNMGGCFASDRITVDGLPVGYMYREEPDDDIDSGWRFLSGDESQDYIDNAEHIGIYDVNTICNFSPDIIPYLNSHCGAAFERDRKTSLFVAVPFNGED
jgi:hypothetical protein